MEEDSIAPTERFLMTLVAKFHRENRLADMEAVAMEIVKGGWQGDARMWTQCMTTFAQGMERVGASTARFLSWSNGCHGNLSQGTLCS